MSQQFIITQPFKAELVEEKGDSNLFLEGFISTTDPDFVNDIVSHECLKSMERQIKERNIKIDIEHEAFRGSTVEEKEINKTKIPVGKLSEPSIEEKDIEGKKWYGLKTKSQINKHHGRYGEIKGSIQDGYLDAYSIAYIPTKTKTVTKEGKSYRILDDVTLLNVALTGNPINTAAEIRNIMMKSIETIEDYQEEKKSNPEVESKLEVKSQEAQPAEEQKSQSPNGVQDNTTIRRSNIMNETEEVKASQESKAFEELKSENVALKAEVASVKDMLQKVLDNQNKAQSTANVENKDHVASSQEPALKSVLGLIR